MIRVSFDCEIGGRHVQRFDGKIDIIQIDIPTRPTEQTLNAVRLLASEVFRQLPTVFEVDRPRQTAKLVRRLRTQIVPRKARPRATLDDSHASCILADAK